MEQYPNGSKYDGYFEDGLRHGVGIMEYSSAVSYVGEWIKGIKQGLGIVELKNKKIYGYFDQDQFKEP